MEHGRTSQAAGICMIPLLNRQPGESQVYCWREPCSSCILAPFFMGLDAHDRLPDALEMLYVPVPRNLAELLGYRGSCRFVGLYWNVLVDEIAYHDGLNGGVGESLRFLEYAGHPNVEAELTMNIGLQDQPATHWLLLDRDCDNLYAGPDDAVRRVLVKQHGDCRQSTIDGCRLEVADECTHTLLDHDAELDQLVAYLDRWSADGTT